MPFQEYWTFFSFFPCCPAECEKRYTQRYAHDVESRAGGVRCRGHYRLSPNGRPGAHIRPFQQLRPFLFCPCGSHNDRGFLDHVPADSRLKQQDESLTRIFHKYFTVIFAIIWNDIIYLSQKLKFCRPSIKIVALFHRNRVFDAPFSSFSIAPPLLQFWFNFQGF